jgi:hypothetical protein
MGIGEHLLFFLHFFETFPGFSRLYVAYKIDTLELERMATIEEKTTYGIWRTGARMQFAFTWHGGR